MNYYYILSIFFIISVSVNFVEATTEVESVGCLQAYAQWVTYSKQCGAPSPTSTSFINSLESFCVNKTYSQGGNCTIANVLALGQQLVGACNFNKTRVQQVIAYMAMSEVDCLKINEHYCVRNAYQMAVYVKSAAAGNATVDQIIAQVKTWCDPVCANALYGVVTRIGSILTDSGKFVKDILGTNKMVCAVYKGELCYAIWMEYRDALKAKNITRISLLACHPCLAVWRQLRGTAENTTFATLMDSIPDWITSCQRDNMNRSCAPRVLNLTQSLGLLTKCATPTSSACRTAANTLIASSGCCVRSLVPFVPDSTKQLLQSLVLPAVCTPANRTRKLKVALLLADIYIDKLQYYWSVLKLQLIEDFAEQIGVSEQEVDVTLSTSTSKSTLSATLNFEITPESTAYDVDSLQSDINTQISQSTLQLSSLNEVDFGLATSLSSGVTVSSGSSSIETVTNNSGAGPAVMMPLFLMSIISLLSLF